MRKRQLARDRLIAAAAQLLQTRTADQLTVADITNAADVGHGTYYLHFKTKHDVLLPLLVAEAARLDEQLRDALRDETDPAVILGVSARFMARHILNEDLWRWFLRNSGVPVDTMRNALGAFGNRDFQAGLQAGRFRSRNARITSIFGFGGYVSTLLEAIDVEQPDAYIDGAVEALLVTFGVREVDAARIAAIPLPKLGDVQASPGSNRHPDQH